MLKTAFTGPDNKTFDEIKLAFAAAVMALICFTGWGIFHDHQHFNIEEFCFGFGTLATAAGISTSAKQLAGAMPPASTPGEPK